MADLYDGKNLLDQPVAASASAQAIVPAPVAAPKVAPTAAPTPAPATTPAPVAPKASPVAAPPTSTPAPTTAPKTSFVPGVVPKSPTVQKTGSSTNPKCELCGKTVYPIETMSMANRSWHKGCFKCEEQGCGISLNLKTATVVEAKVYCQKHTIKIKPTATTVDGNLVHASIASVPKLNKAQGVKKDSRLSFHPGSGDKQ